MLRRGYAGRVGAVKTAVGISRPGRLRVFVRAALLAGALALCAPAAAGASANPANMLTYMPTELVHSIHSAEEVEGYFAELGEYGIGQALLQMPRFTKRGTIRLPESNRAMLGVWARAAQTYDATHGAQATVTAVFNAALKPKGLNLELAVTRQRMVAEVLATVAAGVQGVQLDLEPYPTGQGYLALLEELDEALGRAAFHGRLSVVAPGDIWTWSPGYLHRVGELVSQVDPTFYDTEYTSIAPYQELIEEGLAYYTGNVPASAAIVPVIPCYSPDPWHIPAVENVPSATAALRVALEDGSRAEGAGLWWWYAFYYGHYGHGDAAAERAAWLSQTLALPFSG